MLSSEWLQKRKRGRKGVGKQRFMHALHIWQILDTKPLREELGYQADYQCLFFDSFTTQLDMNLCICCVHPSTRCRHANIGTGKLLVIQPHGHEN